MVASESEAASQIAADVLRAGGNAADAAIALSFAVSVAIPHGTGIGGGGFFLHYAAKPKKITVLDMRERAPHGSTRDMFLKNGKVVPDLSLRGGLSVATPGLVAGLWEIYQTHSSKKIPWKDLVLPSVRLAREGFEVSDSLARNIKEEMAETDWLNKCPETRRLLTRVDGTPLQAGDRYKNPDLARTLETIAEKGKDGFYKGWVAKEILASIKRYGGIVTEKDLLDYRVKSREPLIGKYRGYDVVTVPPPSSGGVHIIQMLNMLEGKSDILARGATSPETIHLKAEVMRRAFADRSVYLGDPDFFTVPMGGLLSKAYAQSLVRTINLEKATPSKTEVKSGNPKPFEKTSTTHFSILDAEGNAVSSTQTINWVFGSAIVAGKTGIFLNDEMDDFSSKPGEPNVFGLVGSEANAIAPGKTPLSSMTPTIVMRDGKTRLIAGSPGGSKIITAVLNVILNVIDHGMTAQDAVFSPRVHHQWLPDVLKLDSGYPATALAALRAKGHQVVEDDLGNVSAVWVSAEGEKVGVSDPRGQGKPIGF